MTEIDKLGVGSDRWWHKDLLSQYIKEHWQKYFFKQSSHLHENIVSRERRDCSSIPTNYTLIYLTFYNTYTILIQNLYITHTIEWSYNWHFPLQSAYTCGTLGQYNYTVIYLTFFLYPIIHFFGWSIEPLCKFLIVWGYSGNKAMQNIDCIRCSVFKGRVILTKRTKRKCDSWSKNIFLT